MLKFRRLGEMTDHSCHECGQLWYDLIRNPSDGPDFRPYVELLGVVGCCQIRTILCPWCAEANAETFFEASGLQHIYNSDREYDRELAIDVLISRIPFEVKDGREAVEQERNIVQAMKLRMVRS